MEKTTRKLIDGFDITKIVKTFEDSDVSYMVVIMKKQLTNIDNILKEVGIPQLQ